MVFGYLPPVVRLQESAPEGSGAPDLNFLKGADTIYEQLAQMGPQGRALYHDFEVVDLLSPLFFGAAVAVAAWFVARRLWPSGPALWTLAGLPLVAAVCDWFENLSMLFLLSHWPTRFENLGNVIGTATTLKFIFSLGAMLATLVGLIVVLVQSRRKRIRSEGARRPEALPALPAAGEPRPAEAVDAGANR
jgi:hypothetical protein